MFELGGDQLDGVAGVAGVPSVSSFCGPATRSHAAKTISR
ncbi:hypothetical protein I551_4908 [Mycobacterium ulcerans str. Harvey]|uniref:Uncharacterized protein n=1 Tax=Mycobacterium ulcerans str. Harvey TaxID=1299332 RepID=A0ABN0QVB7_MYCUL|nr:hypothetical protein I551_4908 [Mycobacterium ulcerans str. Harvey]